MPKPFLAALAAILLLALGATAAAAQSGTPAWSKRPLVLMQGPGTEYKVVGEIEAEVRIRVDRCHKLWCHVHKGREAGWAKLYSIDFGEGPGGRYKFPKVGFNWGGPGQVCLYEGANFTGKSLCVKPGFRSRDLLLLGADNRFSSVRIEGRTSVLLCRDRDYVSFCIHYNDSQKRLHGFLDNNVSSVIVY
jgi:hypothetical protein